MVTSLQRRARALATLRMLGVEVNEPEVVLEARVLDWDEIAERPELLEVPLAERRRLITSRSARARYESFAPSADAADVSSSIRRAL